MIRRASPEIDSRISACPVAYPEKALVLSFLSDLLRVRLPIDREIRDHSRDSNDPEATQSMSPGQLGFLH